MLARPTELGEALAVGGGGGRVGEIGFAPKLMSSYSMQSVLSVVLVLGDESSPSSSVRLSSRGEGEVGVVSVSSEDPLMVTLISLKCLPALLAATHLYVPSSAPDTGERTREPL